MLALKIDSSFKMSYAKAVIFPELILRESMI